MAIVSAHIPFDEEIFAIEGFLAEPLLIFGFQDIGLDDQHPGIANRLKRVLATLGSPDSRKGIQRQIQYFLNSIKGRAKVPDDYFGATHLGDVLKNVA